MAQIARKLAKKVNCDLGHSLFVDKSRIKFFCIMGEKFDLDELLWGVHGVTAKGLYSTPTVIKAN